MKTVLKVMLVVILFAIVGLISAVIGILVFSNDGSTTESTVDVTQNKDSATEEGNQADENKDADDDQLPNDWETKYNLDPNDASDATADGDSDGLNNLEEYKYNTSPDNADTDGDGHSDGDEVKNGYNPRGTGKLSDSNTGETYYVATNGDDSAAGTQSAPWRTLQRAADSTQAGDKIYINEGTYQEKVDLKNSGKDSSPIFFTGADKEKTIISGGFDVKADTDYITIENLTIKDFDIWGITLLGDNNYFNLRNLIVDGGDAGVHFTYGDSGKDPEEGPVSNIVVQDSTIKNPRYTGVDCTPGPCNDMTFRNLEVTGAGLGGEDSYGADGIAVEKGENITVEQCYVHDNGGDGVDLNSRDREGNVSGINVKRNRIVRNHMTGIKLWGGGQIENNVVWGQGNIAIAIGAFPGTYELLYNSVAYNMWSKDFGARNYTMLAGYPNDETGQAAEIKLTMLNNIFAFNADPLDGGATGIYLGENVKLADEGNNIYYSRMDCEIEANFVNQADPCIGRSDISDGSWTEASGQGDQDKVADPKFVSGWGDVDLKLRANSPAIDAGTSSQPAIVDIEGNERPEAYYSHDIGAHEYPKKY